MKSDLVISKKQALKWHFETQYTYKTFYIFTKFMYLEIIDYQM